MKTHFQRASAWLLPAVLILFILEIATLPLVLSLTYAGRSESPDRVLTYSTGLLTWDSAAGILESGAAELSLFDSLYDNVRAEDGANVLAPGTEGDSIVRLENTTGRGIRYTAVVYEIKSSESLDIVTALNGDGFVDTEAYTLPEGVAAESVIRAVEGTVPAGQLQDFDIDWQWAFERDREKDINDTALGNKSAAGDPDDVVIGFWIVVEDEGQPYTPHAPKTGDTAFVEIYVIILCVSAAALVALVCLRRKKREEEAHG